MSATVRSENSILGRIRDLRLLPLGALLWGCTILALYSFAWLITWTVLVLGFVGIVGILLPRWPWIRTLGVHLVVAALLVGTQSLALGFMQAERETGIPGVLTSASNGARIDVVTVSDPVAVKIPGIDKDPAPQSSAPHKRYAIQAKLTTLAGKPYRERITIFAAASWADLAPGTKASTFGTFRLQEQPNRALYSVGVQAPPQIMATDPVMESTNQWRESLRSVSGQLSPGAKELLPGMVIGDTSDLSEALSDDMKVAGLTHLLTVSGANCTYILAFVWLCLRAFKVPRPVTSALGLMVLVGFVLVVRPEPSVVRAAVMGALGAFAIMNGRGKVAFNVLVVSVVVLLLIDPWLAIQFGFALSVAATLGLIVLAPVLSERLERWMPGWLATAVSVPLSAQIACTPILLGLQDYVGLYAVAANLLVGILVPFITVFGMLAMVMVQLGLLLDVVGVPFLADGARLSAQAIATPAGWGTEAIAAVARLIADLPLAKLPWLEGSGGIALAFLVVAAIVVWAFGLWPKITAVLRAFGARLSLPLPLPGWARREQIGRGDGQMTVARSPLFARALVVVVVVTFGVAWWLIPLRNGGLQDADLVACDVGQGDGLFVKTGADTALVFDSGVEPGPMTACLQRAGVKQIQVLFLTHGHADHSGGAENILANFMVDRLVYSSAGTGLKPVLDMAATKNVQVEQGTTGLTGIAGDTDNSGASAGSNGAGGTGFVGRTLGIDDSRAAGATGAVRWTVLWPLRAPRVSRQDSGAEGSAENNVSLVVRVDWPSVEQGGTVSALLTGDIEQEAARSLLRSQSEQFWSSIGILKVAHHGSAGSGTELIDAIRPRIALISVGLNNDYGHPRPEILTALDRIGSRILRTDLGGDQLVTVRSP